MNMISTGAFLTEMDASNKQPTVAEKFAAVWEKKNAKAARAGGVSLMALSLAACGGSSSTTTTTTTTTPAADPEPTTPVAQSLTLTVGTDNVTAGDGDDTITASEAPTAASAVSETLSIGDTINGGAGTDTLKIISSDAYTALPVGLTLTSIENVTVLGGNAVTIDTSSHDSVVSVAVTEATGAITVTGAATQAISINDKVLTGNVTVDGGTTVDVTAKGMTAETTTIGGTTAAKGAVTVDLTTGTADTNSIGAVAVTGGTTISVTQTAGNAAKTGVDTVGGAVTITGNADTTAVTSIQSDNATGLTATASAAGKVGFANADVDITDANAASATKAGTIATVTLTGFKGTNADAATVNSGALTTLNLSGTGSDDLDVTAGALTTAVVDTLALNLNGFTHTASAGGRAIVIDADYTTINLDSSGTKSTVGEISIAGAKTLNVTGDAAATFTASTVTALKTVTVTNSAGFVMDDISATTTFTGGAGKDGVTLANAMETTIDMGAGDDTVTYGGATSTTAGKVGAVKGGDGKDTIVMTSAQAAAADGTAAFNTAFTGFEVLKVSNELANSTTIDVNGLNAASEVVLAAGGNNATGSVIDKIASGGTVETQASGTAGFTVNVNNAALNAADVLNLKLTNSTNAADDFLEVNVANVETINITTNDSGTAGNAAATIDVLNLDAAAAKTITVTGNNGLNVDLTGNTAMTSFDASGVVGDSAATVDTAANLAVLATSANTTATATVTMTGGAGNDTLTGNAAKDTLIGNAGDDILTGNAAQDTITGGTGTDIIAFASTAGTSTDSSTAAADVITDFTLSGALTAQDLSSNANIISNTKLAGDVMNVNLTQAGGANQAIGVEGNVTAAAGSAAGVTATVASGILTLGGAGAAAVDTLAEWIVEAANIAGTNGDILAFEFSGDTYVFAQNGAHDVLVELDGVTGAAALLEVTNATTAVDNTILFADV